MSNPIDRLGDPEHWRFFTEAEKEQIWELFFGNRWSLNHIAQEFGVIKEKIVQVIEDPEMNARHSHSSGSNKRRGIILQFPDRPPVKRANTPSKKQRKSSR